MLNRAPLRASRVEWGQIPCGSSFVLLPLFVDVDIDSTAPVLEFRDDGYVWRDGARDESWLTTVQPDQPSQLGGRGRRTILRVTRLLDLRGIELFRQRCIERRDRMVVHFVASLRDSSDGDPSTGILSRYARDVWGWLRVADELMLLAALRHLPETGDSSPVLACVVVNARNYWFIGRWASCWTGDRQLCWRELAWPGAEKTLHIEV